MVAVPVQHKQGIEGCQKQASQASALSQENPSLKPACKSCFGCHKGAALTSGTQWTQQTQCQKCDRASNPRDGSFFKAVSGERIGASHCRWGTGGRSSGAQASTALSLSGWSRGGKGARDEKYWAQIDHLMDKKTCLLWHCGFCLGALASALAYSRASANPKMKKIKKTKIRNKK